jgi:hypothetical protein
VQVSGVVRSFRRCDSRVSPFRQSPGRARQVSAWACAHWHAF